MRDETNIMFKIAHYILDLQYVHHIGSENQYTIISEGVFVITLNFLKFNLNSYHIIYNKWCITYIQTL